MATVDTKNNLHPEQKYLAFISYRHADNTEEDKQWATWLHQQLEVYDIPAELIGTENQRGEIIPERIYPVFRDEVSLPADADLATSITTALDQSQFLIVLCSPRAVQSQYVNKEILHFKQIGKQNHIMAALLLGEPNASIDPTKEEDPENAHTLECFPQALQYHLDEQGKLDKTNRTEPLAANFRLPNGDKGVTSPSVYRQQLVKQGKSKAVAERLANAYDEQLNNSKLKIIAGILGVQLEQLIQRDKAHQLKKAKTAQKRSRHIALIMAVFTFISLVAVAIAVKQWKVAEEKIKDASHNLGLVFAERAHTERVQPNASFYALSALDKLIAERSKDNYSAMIKIASQSYKSFEKIYRINSSNTYPSVHFSPDGNTIAAATFNSVKLWDVATGKELSSLGESLTHLTGSISFSPDGNTIAVGGEKGTIQLWDVATGKEQPTLNEAAGQFPSSGSKGLSNTIISTAFSPNGDRIVSGSANGSILLWDIASGQNKPMMKERSAEIYSVAFSPDGNTIAAGFGGSVHLWDSNTARELERFKPEEFMRYINSIAFSPDGKTIAASGHEHGTIYLWELDSGRTLALLNGHSKMVRSIAFSPDGNTIVSGSEDGTILLWSLSGERVVLDAGSEVFSVAFSSDGNTIASHDREGSIILWSFLGESRRRFREYSDDIIPPSIFSAALSHDENTIVAGSDDRTIHLWDLTTGKKTFVWKNLIANFSQSKIILSPDGNTIVVPSKGISIQRLDIATGKELPILEGHSSRTFPYDGKTVASDIQEIVIEQTDADIVKKQSVPRLNIVASMSQSDLDKASDLLLSTLPTGTVVNYQGKQPKTAIDIIAFSPDGNTIAAANQNGMIYRWDTNSGKELLTLTGASTTIDMLAFSPSGSTIAAVNQNGMIYRWDTNSGKELLTLSGASTTIDMLAFSPSGSTIAAVNQNGTVDRWDIDTGKELPTLRGASTTIDMLAFSPDENTIAAANHDGTIYLWDTNIGKELQQPVLSETPSFIDRLTFSPDGSTIATSGLNGTVSLWNLTSGTGLSLQTVSYSSGIAFSPNSKTIATSPIDSGLLQLWDVATGKELFAVSGSPFDNITFSTDGNTIIASDSAQSIWLWDFELLTDVNVSTKLNNLKNQMQVDMLVTNVDYSLWPKNNAFYWLPSARQGDGQSMIELGNIYLRNDNIEQASKWFSKALSSPKYQTIASERLHITDMIVEQARLE